MTYAINGYLPPNPATGAIANQTVQLWDGTRFSPVNTPPATNGSAPSGSPDFGPISTANGEYWQFTGLTSADQWIVQTWDPADTSNGGTYNTYWLGPYNIDPSTNLQGWTTAADQRANRTVVLTTIASGSNGQTLPFGTIDVASTAGFPTSGIIIISVGTGYQPILYTGTSGGNSFTGCTGGTGTLATGRGVFTGYPNGPYRRLVFPSIITSVTASSDVATIQPVSSVTGVLFNVGGAGIADFLNTGGHVELLIATSFPVDPNGYYGVYPNIGGTGTVTATPQHWIEVDF